MNKPILKRRLASLALAAALLTPALPAAAQDTDTPANTRHFVQVKSIRQIQDGGNYAFAHVHDHADFRIDDVNVGAFYTLNDNNKVVLTKSAEVTNIPDNMIWTLKVDRYYNCTCTNEAHGDSKTFHFGKLVDGTMKYIQQGINNDDDNAPRYHTSTLEVNATTDHITATEVVTLPEQTGFTGEQLFLLHAGWRDSAKRFIGVRAVSMTATNNFDRWSSDNDANGMKVLDNNKYTSLTRFYLVIDEDHPETVAQVYWNAKIEDCTNWANSINPELAEAICEIPLPTDIEWDITITEAGDLDALTAQIDTAFRAAFDAVVLNYFATSGNQYAFKNVGTNNYVTLATDNHFNAVEELTNNGIWDVVANDGAMSFKLHNQEIYAGELPTSATPVTQVTSLEQAGKYHFQLVNNGGINVFIKRSTDGPQVAEQWHCNSGNLQQYSGTGGFSQWIIEEVGARIHLLKAEADIAELRTRVAALGTNGLVGLYTTDEISALTNVINNLSYAYDPTMSDEQIENLIASNREAADNAVSNFIEKIEGKPVFIMFTRSSHYVRVKNEDGTRTFEAIPQVGASSVWIFQHQGNLAFKLYNPSEQVYMSGHTDNPSYADEDNGHLIWHLASCTASNNTYHYHPILVNEDKSGNNVLHQSTLGANVSGYPTATIWYTQGDPGSSIEIYYTAEAIIEKMQTESVEKATLDTYANKVSATHDLGKFRTDGYEAAKAVFNDLNSESVSAENILASFASLDAAVAESQIINAGLLIMPAAGDFIRATASAGNPAHGQATLHYTTRKYDSTSGNWMYVGADEATDANSIFYFNDNKLVSYSSGFYIATDAQPRLSFNTNHSDNMGVDVTFVNGDEEIDAYQIILGTNTNIHIYEPGNGKALHLDRCGATGTKTDAKKHNWNLELVNELPIALNGQGYGSLIAPVAVKFTTISDDCMIYIQDKSQNQENIRFKTVAADEVIPAGTPILVAGAAATATIVYDTTTETPAEVRRREGEAQYPIISELVTLHGSHIAKAHATTNGYTTLALTRDAVNGTTDGDVHFTKVNDGDALNAQTLHLTLPDNINELVKETVLSEDGTTAVVNLATGVTTGIHEIESATDSVDAQVVYDLQGRRLSAPIRGINIINGKKILVN